MSDQTTIPSLIIDLGSGYTKAGLSNEAAPNCILPTMVGIPKHSKMIAEDDEQKYYIGRDNFKKGLFKMQYIITNGFISDWESMTAFFQYIFKDLKITDPSQVPISLLMNPSISNSEYSSLAALLFEYFHCPKLLLASTSYCNLISSGVTSGCIIDTGDSTSTTLSYIKGIPQKDSFMALNLGGRDVTQELCKIMRLTGLIFHTSGQMEYVRNLKETECKVFPKDTKISSASIPLTPIAGQNSNPSYKFKEKGGEKDKRKLYLPDGEAISFEEEWNKCWEIYYSNVEHSLPSLLYNSYSTIDPQTRKSMQTVACGGNMQIPSFIKRLVEEMEAYLSMKSAFLGKAASTIYSEKIIARWHDVEGTKKYTSAWNGASIALKNGNIEKMWIERKEYEEKGRKCVDEKYVLQNLERKIKKLRDNL